MLGLLSILLTSALSISWLCLVAHDRSQQGLVACHPDMGTGILTCLTHMPSKKQRSPSNRTSSTQDQPSYAKVASASEGDRDDVIIEDTFNIEDAYNSLFNPPTPPDPSPSPEPACGVSPELNHAQTPPRASRYLNLDKALGFMLGCSCILIWKYIRDLEKERQHKEELEKLEESHKETSAMLRLQSNYTRDYNGKTLEVASMTGILEYYLALHPESVEGGGL